MNKETILKRAIEKAFCGKKVPHYLIEWGLCCDENCNVSITKGIEENYFRIIFSHDFAKCLWGEDYITTDYFQIDQEEMGDGYEGVDLPAWKYHLQQMVLEKEPLKYIAKFL